jgi:hypothetical protein
MTLFGRIAKKGDRRKTKRDQIPYQRFQRHNAEVRIKQGDVVCDGRVFLHDLTPDGVGLFVELAFERNQELELVVHGPRKLYLKGKVVWREDSHMTSRVIRARSYPYRIGVKLDFDNKEDREVVRLYCEELSIRREAGSASDAERSLKRKRLMISALSRYTWDQSANLDQVIALNPTKDELAIVFKVVTQHYQGAQEQGRINQAHEMLVKLLGVGSSP